MQCVNIRNGNNNLFHNDSDNIQNETFEMKEFEEITLVKTVRTLTRTGTGSNTLSNKNMSWLQTGTTIWVGRPMKMVYDHKEQTVIQIADTMPERFIILSELNEDPWYLRPPTT
jgi:hypothetical protein